VNAGVLFYSEQLLSRKRIVIDGIGTLEEVLNANWGRPTNQYKKAHRKPECIYRKDYVTMEEIKTDLLIYVELFCNRMYE
jgi:hypothetical protein